MQYIGYSSNSTLIARVEPFVTGQNFQSVGVGFYSSSSGKFASVRFTDNGDGGLQVDKWTSTSSYSAAYLAFSTSQQIKWTWVKLKDDGTNRITSVSADGNNWIRASHGRPHRFHDTECILHLGRREQPQRINAL